MAVILRNDRIPRVMMGLCFGAAAVLFLGQWRSWVATTPRSASGLAMASVGQGTAQPIPGVRLVADLSDRRVYLYNRQTLMTSYAIAIGQEGWETPVGDFRVTQMRRNPVWKHPFTHTVYQPGPDNPLGARWIEFWATKDLHFGFHGTNEDDLIGQAVSHGCLRMRNQDVEQLYDQISVGTPLSVRP
jgi:L,D-transpeptidase ErfK/SrfK